MSLQSKLQLCMTKLPVDLCNTKHASGHGGRGE